ncbi:MAG TPA: hypothetical protein VD866_09255, partial [Urbifossiella sp.]|nr:hypothetical protein [Urbifossiella sp.]
MTNTARLRVEPLEDRATPSAAGDPDPTFSGDGTTTTTAGPVSQLALTPDGHILALTSAGLARLEADGDPDPTFAGGGVAAPPTDSGIGTIAAAPDGGAFY